MADSNEPREQRERFKRAVALRYDMERDQAPRVLAKGDRLQAERIVEIAREHGIHVHEDTDLVALLAQLDVGQDIPESSTRPWPKCWRSSTG